LRASMITWWDSLSECSSPSPCSRCLPLWIKNMYGRFH
jgi:hypothetical protein